MKYKKILHEIETELQKSNIIEHNKPLIPEQYESIKDSISWQMGVAPLRLGVEGGNEWLVQN